MKLSLYILVGSLVFVPVVFADDEEAPAAEQAAPAENQESSSESSQPESSSEAVPSAEQVESSTVKSNLEELKLEEEKPSDNSQTLHSLSPLARENMTKINETVREINAQQRSIYEKKMGVDAELESFTSAFADRRGRLMVVADSVNDYITAQSGSEDAGKEQGEAHQKRADFLKQAVASLSDFRSSLSDLAIKDKVLEQQDEALGVILSKSLEDLNAAVKTAAEAQKHRNDVSLAATDDAVAQAEAGIAAALKSVQLTLVNFKDELAKDIDAKIVTFKDAIKSMNEALDQTQKKGDELKDLLKNIQTQDGVIAKIQKAVVDEKKVSVVAESAVVQATDKTVAKEKKEVVQVSSFQALKLWIGYIAGTMHSVMHYFLSFIYSPTKKEDAAPVIQKDLSAQASQSPSSTPVAVQPAQDAQQSSQVAAPVQNVQVQANQVAVATPVAAATASVASSVGGQSAVADASALSPKNPVREEDLKQVQTVGKALGKSVARAWAAIVSFFNDIKNGLFEPSDTSHEDVRPAAAKTVTIQSQQTVASPAPTAPSSDSSAPVSSSVVAPEKTGEASAASPVVAS